MQYYELEPEVAGGIGKKSEIIYKDGMIDEVTFLHYEFFGWLGDELLTTDPCFIVTESLMNDIISSGLEGIEFKDIKVSFSDEYDSAYDKTIVPNFMEIKCKFVYEENIDNLTCDFYRTKYDDLIVSEKALFVLRHHKIDFCKIEKID